MRLTYRARQFYRRLFRVILVLVLAVLLLLLCWVLWLRRFIIYTDNGARLDFGLSQQWPQGQTGQVTTAGSMPDIYFTQDTTLPPPVEEENAFSGYYVTVEELQKDLDGVLTQIQALPEGTPVMLDVKNHWGYFYYTSDCGASSNALDASAMDAFLAAVNASGAHAIARLPAFRDYAFAEDNLSCGLKESRGYLWVDENKCYWLDPAKEETLDYLISICQELRRMGFAEVALQNFCIPESDQIVYQEDRATVIADAALALANACTTAHFTVSFITDDPAFPLPAGSCRLYLENVAAADVETVLTQLSGDAIDRVVFFTATNDTRFERCGVLRPLHMAR